MKSLFEKSASTEIINRVKCLKVSLKPTWGKMNVAQMLAHCSSFLDIAMGYSNPKRGWLGTLRFVKDKMAYSTYLGTFPSPFYLRLAEEKISW